MAKLPIVEYPDPILLKQTGLVKDANSPEIQKLIIDMLETMEKNNGVGLAAPQVGKSLRLCVIRVDDEEYILVNPKITYRSWVQEICEEGCLSFPGKFIPVSRPKKVHVNALDGNGEKISLKAEGLLARVLQHEIDHLDGKVFIEKEVKKKKNAKR